MPHFVAIRQTVAEIWRFFNFQYGGRRHLGLLNFRNFYGRNAQKGQTASSCQILWRSVKPLLRYSNFSIWRPSAILDLLCARLDHPRRAFGGLYHCVKCVWNRSSSFGNMHVSLFREFGLTMPIHAPKMGFGGIWSPKWERYQQNPKRHILARWVWPVSKFPKKGINWKKNKKWLTKLSLMIIVIDISVVSNRVTLYQ